MLNLSEWSALHMKRLMSVAVAAGALWLPTVVFGQPLLGTNPAIPPNLQITAFATGLSLPYGLYQLPDGSILTATSDGLTPAIRRFTQSGGVADAPTTVFTGGVGVATGVATGLAGVGNIVVLATGTGDASQITIFQAGAGGVLTSIGQMNFDFPPSFWWHDSHTIGMRAVPGQPTGYELVFNIGSEFNDIPSVNTVSVSGLVNATLNPNSIYRLAFDVSGATVTPGAITQLASGLRNAFALGYNAAGDVYFGENGIDLGGTNTPVSTDYFGIIGAGASGVLDFGFPSTYYDPVDGHVIGPSALVTAPFTKFLPAGGMATQGVGGLAIAPSGFPAGLNNGAFFGFYGKHTDGAQNDLGGVLFADAVSGQYFSFIGNSQSAINHPMSFLATNDALYIADFGGDGALDGTIFRVALSTSVPEPSTLMLFGVGLTLGVSARRFRRARAALVCNARPE